MKTIAILPKMLGKHEELRADGRYGYVCNTCGYPVRDGDGYCSECGARVSDTLFYLGMTYSKCDHDFCFPCYCRNCSEYISDEQIELNNAKASEPVIYDVKTSYGIEHQETVAHYLYSDGTSESIGVVSGKVYKDRDI